MPKENINDPFASDYGVAVVWGRASEDGNRGDVQIVTTCHGSEARFPSPEAVPTDNPNVFGVGEPTWSEPCEGFYVTLNEAAIDRLMVALRRAKMQAYPPRSEDLQQDPVDA